MIDPDALIDVKLLHQPVLYLPLDDVPDGAGGECVFLGRTRLESHAVHGRLLRLAYEAYEPMALSVLRGLGESAVDRFGCQKVRIHHALGEVPPGQASVLVQVVCPHRAAAFESCRYLIDALKAQAPIWKREEWADGSTWSAGTPVNVVPGDRSP